MLYDEKIEALISAALADGVLTEKEKQVLFKKAQAQGIDLDEFEMVLDARLVELEKAEKEKAAASAPKSTKYGDVRKCPVCGAMVPALTGVCPECGYEFSGVDANLSSQKLADLLKAEDQKYNNQLNEELTNFEAEAKRKRLAEADRVLQKRKIERDLRKKHYATLHTIITTFPIPNTKADLFEFISALTPKVDDKNIGNAYFVKLDECIIKAKSLFPNDEIFVKLIKEYEIDKAQRKRKLIIKICTIVAALIAVIIIACVAVNNYQLRHDKEKCEAAMKEAILNGNLSKAYKLMTRYNDYISEIDDAIILLVQAYIDNNDLESAKNVVEQCERRSGYFDYRVYLPIGYYLIEQGQYEEAEKYMHCEWISTCTEYIYFAAQHMCKNGEVKKAQIFYNQKMKQYAQIFNQNLKEKQKFVKIMNDLIASYK